MSRMCQPISLIGQVDNSANDRERSCKVEIVDFAAIGTGISVNE
jgi:hypothetical protein